MKKRTSNDVSRLIQAFCDAKHLHRQAFAELDAGTEEPGDFARKEKSVDELEAALLAARPGDAAEAVERARFLIAELIDDLPAMGMARRFAETLREDIERMADELAGRGSE